MALSFPNVALLGLTQDNRFFGAGFEYQSVKRLTIEGLVIDLDQSFGITGLWTGFQGVLPTINNDSRDYQDLFLNGVSFGSGKIQSINFSPGLDVRTKSYTADIIVQSSGNLFNFTGLYYSGVDISNFQYLNSFSEDYSFTRKQNQGYGYTHNATIQFSSGVGRLNAIGAAQSVARTLFTGSNLGFAFYSGYTNKQGKRYITETYSLIDNVCGFQETFDFDADDGNYSAIQTTSIQIDDIGVTTATEQGTIRGIENPNYQKALSALSIEMTGAYVRCSGAATNYFSGNAILVTSPISQGRTIDIFNNNIGYVIVFNNSPINQRTYFWDYSLQMEKTDGISSVTENGSVVGRAVNPTTAFSAAQSGYAIVQPGIAGRCGALFVSPFNPGTNFLAQKRESYAPAQGQIGYTYQYSNDPTLIADAGIRRKEVTQEDAIPIYAYNKVNIFNDAEIAQNDYQSTVGSTALTIELEGDKTVGLFDFLAAAITEINSRAPAGNDRHIGGCTYSYSPNTNSANVQFTWLYNLPAGQTINP